MICLFLSLPSFSVANMFHLSFTALLIRSSSCPKFILLFDYSGGAWNRCKRNMVQNQSYYRGRMTNLSSSLLSPPPPQEPTRTQTQPLRPLHTALQVFETVITVGDLQSSFRDARPLAKVTGAIGFISPCATCVKYEACVLYEALSNGVSPLTLPLSLLRVGLERVSNTLSVCFPVHHCVHSPDSAL